VSGRRRLALVGLLVAGIVVLPAAAAAAHPLGNFTINRYSGLRLEPGRVTVDHVVDMAEIPAFQTRQEIDADRDGTVTDAEAASWRQAACPRLAAGLRLRLDGRQLVLGATAGRVSFPPGAGGLPTLRLECRLVASTGRLEGAHALSYQDANDAERIGWREITATGDGVTLVGDHPPAASVSARLTSYPKSLLRAPLDQRSTSLSFRPGGARRGGPEPAAGADRAAVPLGVDNATRLFTGLVARQHLGLGFGLLAVLLALLLGAVHALAPGHGKTVMAAYLVGLRGSLRQAAAIGATVTATHTAGVLALGVLLTASRAVAPERVYPWLGLASGLLLAAVGLGLVRRALAAPAVHGHHHGDVHGHRHGRGGHDHPHGPVPAAAGRPPGWRGLVVLGLAGGMVPSPSALLVLLGGIALGRAWFGVVLVLAYGIGMAATLTGVGMLLAHARGRVDRRLAAPRGALVARAARVLPLATASVIVVVGLALAARGAAQL
jgi:nickel/cobalt transporter (NicO) family protein